MKNPLRTTDARLSWWHTQADELLKPAIGSVTAGPRSTIRTDKHNRTAIITIDEKDLRDFTSTPTGNWIIDRLAFDTGITRPNAVLHTLIFAGWIFLLLFATTTISADAATGIFAYVAGILSALAQILYLRNKLNHSAGMILNADRNATLNIGREAAAIYFDTRIDGIYRSPIHAFISRQSAISPTNRATRLGLHVGRYGEVTCV